MLGVLRDAAREAGCLAKANDDMVNLDGSCFLVGIGDELWRISPWFSRHRDARGIDALGSGRDIAIGVAWTMRARRGAWDAVVLALQTAEEFSEGVRRPFTILETTA